MLIGRISKETTDVNRVTLEFSKWLDTGGSIETIQSSLISRDDSGWADVPPPWPLPDDITPLRFQTIGLIDGATEVQMYLESGTPGNAYTVKIIIWDTANRQLTVELGVEITGYPPNPPIGGVPLLSDGALSRLGGEMFGPLYLYADPLQPNEAANKNYIDTARRFLQGEIDTEVAARIAGDNALQVQITNEVNRATASEAALGIRIDQEASARATGDTNLQTAITNEANARAAADNNLQTEITNETNARVAADSTLQNNINHISLTPGPQGPQGPQGVPGPTGPAGSAGAAGADSHGLQSGWNSTDGSGHARVNFAVPFSGAPAIAATVKQAGSLLLVINAVADSNGIDVWIAAPNFPLESPYPWATEFFWMASMPTQ